MFSGTDMNPQMQTRPSNPERDTDTDVDQDELIWVETPYRVLIHNDNITTFEFVIDLLQKVFKHPRSMAEQIATITHMAGTALVCVRPQGEAERLVNQSIFAARLEGFPLMLSCEADEG